MDKDLKETMLKAADYTDDHMNKVMKRMQILFVCATVCGALYILGVFFGPETESVLYSFAEGVLLGIMFGALILGIIITGRNFKKFAEWKHSKLGNSNG